MTTISNQGVFTVNDSVINEVDIQLRLVDLNYATFISSEYLSAGGTSTITIEYPAAGVVGYNQSPAFTGVVTQCRKLARTDDGKTRYAIECVEPAVELQNRYITVSSDLRYTGLFISNVNKTKSLSTYVSNILSGTGWKDISDAQYKDKTIVSGGASTDSIPSMGFSSATAWSALQRLIVTIFNYGLWFDYPNGTKCIRYGEYNRDVYKFPTPINITLQEHNNNYVVDGVVVYADDPKISPQTVGTIGVNKKVVIYKYSYCQSEDELKWVAKKVYDDRKYPNTRYEIEFPVGFYDIKEGDRIHIYDTSIGMEHRDEGYGVKDVRIMYDKTVVGVGSAKLTVFDILNDRLSIIDGNSLSLLSNEIDTGWMNVYNDVGNDINTWGATAEDDFVIAGETFMGELKLTPYFAAAGIENSGLFRVYSAIGFATQQYTITSAASLYVLGWDNVEETGPFHPDYYPWTWKWVEIEAYYIFDVANPEGIECQWSCYWGTADSSVSPPTIVEMADVFDAGGTTTSSSNTSQIHHKWFVSSRDEMPHSYPILHAEIASGGDTLVLNDVVVKTTVFYESDSYAPITMTQASGEIQMKIYAWDNNHQEYWEATDWISIYNTIDNPDDTFDGIEYDMSEYLDYTQFGTGNHKVWYRCRAGGDVNHNGDCSVRLIGSYAGFDEKTRVIP